MHYLVRILAFLQRYGLCSPIIQFCVDRALALRYFVEGDRYRRVPHFQLRYKPLYESAEEGVALGWGIQRIIIEALNPEECL
jgi:hypothetical protein